MTVSKDQLVAALSTMRAGRTPAYGNRAIQSIIRQFGGGASGINELAATHYAAVLAAVAIPTPADHYGTITDVPPLQVERVPVAAPPAPSRIRTPMVADLEARLATARAKTKRSVPNYVVNIGNPAHFGDEDAVPDYPSDGRKIQ